MIQPITHLKIVEPLPVKGGAIDEFFRIGNHAETAGAFADKFKDSAGTLNTFQIANNYVYAYSANRYAKGEINETDGAALMHSFMVKTQLLMLALWMVKDNSANAYEAYLRLDDDTGPHFIGERFSNWFFMADCELRVIAFTRAEFEAALGFYEQFDRIIPKLPHDEKRVSGLIHDSRVVRTLYFVQAARATADLLVKIAFYCMCLESLFSTDKEGITYRVAERNAFFIGNHGPERRAIFDDVSRLYNTRSKVVHGDLVKKAQLPDLFERVKRGDDYLRRCLTKILGDPAMLELFSSKANEDIIEHFKAQVFDR